MPVRIAYVTPYDATDVSHWSGSSFFIGRALRMQSMEVDFVGPVFDERELVRSLKTSAIFVYPSVAAKGEALPLAPVEAMACGCSVILSALDCFNDYLENGVNGLVFDQNDVSGTDLARKLDRLVSDAGLRSALSEAAVSTARRFTREVVAEEFIADFHALLSQRP